MNCESQKFPSMVSLFILFGVNLNQIRNQIFRTDLENVCSQQSKKLNSFTYRVTNTIRLMDNLIICKPAKGRRINLLKWFEYTRKMLTILSLLHLLDLAPQVERQLTDCVEGLKNGGYIDKKTINSNVKLIEDIHIRVNYTCWFIVTSPIICVSIPKTMEHIYNFSTISDTCFEMLSTAIYISCKIYI